MGLLIRVQLVHTRDNRKLSPEILEAFELGGRFLLALVLISMLYMFPTTSTVVCGGGGQGLYLSLETKLLHRGEPKSTEILAVPVLGLYIVLLCAWQHIITRFGGGDAHTRGTSMSASAIFFLDQKGKVLISRNYRGDIPMSVVDKFCDLLYVQTELCFSLMLHICVVRGIVLYISLRYSKVLLWHVAGKDSLTKRYSAK